MAVVRSGSVEAGLRRLDPAIRVILFYGFDEARIRQLAVTTVRKLAGAIDDPFNVERLSEADLAKTPGRLVDEVQSQSLLGGRRVIWFEDVDAEFAKALGPVLKAASSGNLIVAEAGNLGKSSPLRTVLETSELAWIVPVYEPGAGEAQEFLMSAFAARGISADPAACTLLVQSYGTDFGLLGQEAEKLALYGLGTTGITVEDVEALCVGGGEIYFDDVIDAAMKGDSQRTEELLVRMEGAGEDLGQVVAACLRHVVRLQELRLAIDRGQSIDQAVRGVRPAIFFKRVAAVTLQLRLWDLSDLVGLASSLADAIAQTRGSQGLAGTIGRRTMLSVAHRAGGLLAKLN